MKDNFMVVLITTVFKGSAVIQAIKLFIPQKVYFLIDEPLNEIRNQTINMIKEFFPGLVFENISAKVYNIVDIAKETIKIIVVGGSFKYFKKDYKVLYKYYG